jgi:hypothetical protein
VSNRRRRRTAGKRGGPLAHLGRSGQAGVWPCVFGSPYSCLQHLCVVAQVGLSADDGALLCDPSPPAGGGAAGAGGEALDGYGPGVDLPTSDGGTRLWRWTSPPVLSEVRTRVHTGTVRGREVCLVRRRARAPRALLCLGVFCSIWRVFCACALAVWLKTLSVVNTMGQAEWAEVRSAAIDAMEPYCSSVAGSRVLIDTFKVTWNYRCVARTSLVPACSRAFLSRVRACVGPRPAAVVFALRAVASLLLIDGVRGLLYDPPPPPPRIAPWCRLADPGWAQREADFLHAELLDMFAGKGLQVGNARLPTPTLNPL